ncbi:MAG: SRPBCC family protein [Nocardioidaceae bacterium]
MSTNALTVTAEPGTPFIDTVREFDATPAQVFRAHVDRDLVGQWLGPRGYEMRIDEFDARTGGSYRYTHKDGDGNEYGFRGCFHAVDEGERLTQTFEFEGAPGHVSLETATFEDIGDGRTRIRVRSAFQSVEDRDAMAATGMEEGMSSAYDQLEELLASQS